MRTLLDTNILVHNANRNDSQHHRVAERLRGLVSAGTELCIASQNLFEFWVVATRPASANRLGLAPGDARKCIDAILEGFTLLPDPADLLTRWLDLCERYSVCGRQAHDARLVGWMISHEIPELLTLNPSDFTRFREIECLGLA
jgi:predicted nucleic acid-binding protein